MTNMDAKALTAEAVELLCRMVERPSVSREEKEVADLLESFMNANGLCPQRAGNNLWCIAPQFDAENRPTLLLNAHIDTVKPAASWTRPPLAPPGGGRRD